MRNYPGAILIVTHDRYFLDNVTGWILELDRGRGIPYEGNYSAWLSQKQKRLAQEGREEEARQRTLAREQEWIAASPRARQAKSKARYQRYEELVKQAAEKTTQTAQIIIPVTERLGQNVVDFEGLTKGFGDNLLIDDLTFKLPPGGIVGVIGPNGAGKTTLFRMIVGQEKPDKGTIKVGESVHLGYVDQSRDALDGKNNVWEEISGGQDIIMLGKREVNSRAYCSNFNFKGADQQKKVGSLSGGERNRVHLAKMLKSGANLLLLDEPTNDLDVDTLRALEEALEDFAGCAVIISHDRWFLDRIATHILAFEGDSHVEWFEGNFQDYEQDKMRRLGTDSDHSPSHQVQEVLALTALRRVLCGEPRNAPDQVRGNLLRENGLMADDWNARQYLKFEDERTRPPRDLLAQVPLQSPRRVIDLGCGPGNSTELLIARYPQAEVIGLDSSPDMLRQARERLPYCTFAEADLATWNPQEGTDLLFANAVFQWVPDHTAVLRRLLERLPEGGVLALQMPDNTDEPALALMREVAKTGPWAAEVGLAAASRDDLPEPAAYYDLLKPLCAHLDIWHTVYNHVMAGPDAIVEWFRGSALRPFLSVLNADMRRGFVAEYRARIARAYPARFDERVLLRFPRLFIVATR